MGWVVKKLVLLDFAVGVAGGGEIAACKRGMKTFLAQIRGKLGRVSLRSLCLNAHLHYEIGHGSLPRIHGSSQCIIALNLPCPIPGVASS